MSSKNFKSKTNYSNSPYFNVKRNNPTNQLQLRNYLHIFTNKNNFSKNHHQFNQAGPSRNQNPKTIQTKQFQFIL